MTQNRFTAFLFAANLPAFAGGAIFGVLKDRSGDVLANAKLSLLNTELKTEYNSSSDARGFYSFPALPVGRYDLTIEAPGFRPQKKANIAVDADAAVRVNTMLELSEPQQVTVAETESDVQMQVDTVAAHLGEVLTDRQIQAIPLNGRSYTDLLAIQPGVTPVTTLTPTSVMMAAVTGAINPAGDLNPQIVSAAAPGLMQVATRFHL